MSLPKEAPGGRPRGSTDRVTWMLFGRAQGPSSQRHLLSQTQEEPEGAEEIAQKLAFPRGLVPTR